MENLNQSLREGVCIDEEVFFGPITDKEKTIKENFEKNYKKTNDTAGVSQKGVDNDISMNDSLFKSFSVDDSKYDSFDDSLNEDNGKSPETKHILLRKSFDKLKQKKHTLYDSLEDICSLASNVEKCSITCDVENDSNLNDKQHVVEDSLQNPKIIITNKNHCASEQIHFDDDSLAIVEFESTFDDSLEDLNVLSNVEIEEIQDVEIISVENCNVSAKMEQKLTCSPRNLFETSVEVIYERQENDQADREESSGGKNIFYDSLSNSDFKDVLKDSLEESGKITDSLSQHVSDEVLNNNQKSKQVSVSPSVKTDVAAIDESLNEFHCDKSPSLEESGKITDSLSQHVSDEVLNNNQNSKQVSVSPSVKMDVAAIDKSLNEFHCDKSPSQTSKSPSNASVQIIRLKDQETETTDQEFLNYINMKNDSLPNSSISLVTKDTFEEIEKCDVNLNHNANVSNVGVEKLEQELFNPENLDSSVQIIYENLQNLNNNENISAIHTASKSDNNSPHFQTNLKHSYEENISKNACNNNNSILHLYDVNSDKSLSKDIQETVTVGSNANQNCKEGKDKSDINKPDLPINIADNSNLDSEVLTLDSCQLKLLNDTLNDDQDLKFQLHIEVTVGDKKCKIAAEDIKLLPDHKVSKKDLLAVKLFENKDETNEVNALEFPDSKLSDKTENPSVVVENISGINLNEIQSCSNFNPIDTANITRRRKTHSEQFNVSEIKLNLLENLSEGNLLQALDLPDISLSFLNESVVQSSDPAILNSGEPDIKKCQTCVCRNESKENIVQSGHCYEEKKKCSPSKETNYKLKKSPKGLQKSPSCKDSSKKTPGTKIPVRKVENFVVPSTTSSKLTKQVSTCHSAEKARKHTHATAPCSAEKKTPMKAPHICKVRNTIFSKVPQITPSKKYLNIQSPVAQYIRNTPGSAKTPVFDPVLRDCMNHLPVHHQSESPSHLYQTDKGGSAKSTKWKV